jgi:hypothetical protein
MYIERANLDVELGRRFRQNKSNLSNQKTSFIPNSTSKSVKPTEKSFGKNHGIYAKQINHNTSSSFSSHPNQNKNEKEKTKRTLYVVPPHSDFPHVFLRCGFCSEALPVDVSSVKVEKLRTQNNVINNCANCSKQLPRCYVCHFHMV